MQSSSPSAGEPPASSTPGGLSTMASSSTASSIPACLMAYQPPLEAPVALDGVDISLATEVLPPPPPILNHTAKKPADYLRKRALPSYLPSTDPGSTYSAGTGVKVIDYVPTTDEESPERTSKRKRPRTDKIDTRQVWSPSFYGGAVVGAISTGLVCPVSLLTATSSTSQSPLERVCWRGYLRDSNRRSRCHCWRTCGALGYYGC